MAKMIDGDKAREAAAAGIRSTLATPDAHFEPLRDAGLGRPVAVHDLAGEPSYWLVPVESAGRSIGFVRVAADGGVAAVGTYYRAPDRLDACPPVVTGITAEQAVALAKKACGGVGALSPPLFVHDGAPGREAWRIEVREGGRPRRWIFAGRGGTYERPAGETPDDGLEG